MKYNPKVNEKEASNSALACLHPLDSPENIQGILEIMHELSRMLAEISGLGAVSLQPSAGAQGELTGLMIASAFFEDKKEERGTILIPDSAHGTNPASAALCGYTVVEVKSDSSGMIDIGDFRRKLDKRTALMMVTNPNTLGIFEERISEIAALLHENGSLLYMDGANLNAMMGVVRPGDCDVDIMHFNLHKTFSTPHGGGGPGSGPVGVAAYLEKYLPVPVIEKIEKKYVLNYNRPHSIGRVRSFYGNIPVMIKAYAYIKTLGGEGLRRVSENAVLNANYLMARLKESFLIPYNTERPCMHEFVVSVQDLKDRCGVTAQDFAKALIDRGIHPPTVYFPLIVPEALMIEPTETESLETLERFAKAMFEIRRTALENPECLKNSPQRTSVSRPDEVQAARNPVLKEKVVCRSKEET